MTIVEHLQFVYPYGAFYKEQETPSSKLKTDNVIIYQDVKGVNREISSLEGLFVCSIELLDGFNPQCRRELMNSVERRYNGKFVPFSRKE